MRRMFTARLDDFPGAQRIQFVKTERAQDYITCLSRGLDARQQKARPAPHRRTMRFLHHGGLLVRGIDDVRAWDGKGFRVMRDWPLRKRGMQFGERNLR